MIDWLRDKSWNESGKSDSSRKQNYCQCCIFTSCVMVLSVCVSVLFVV